MATFPGSASAQATSSTVISGLLFEHTPVGIKYARKYVGEPHMPQDMLRLRRQVYDAMRHLGSPVLVKHMYNDRDVREGRAIKSPNFDETYGQVRHRDPVSHGVGFVSAETADNEWLLPDGTIEYNDTQPADSVPAPKYRGFGPSYLIYVIQPDVPEDVFKVGEAGALIKTQNAMAQAPWYPEIGDNDLIINVVIDQAGNILEAQERYQAKQVSKTTIRGYDKRGRRESAEIGGNRWTVNQTFQMALIPPDTAYHDVETDR